MHATALLCVAQSLLSCQIEGSGPVRFGVPLPAKALERGLRIAGPPDAELQWRLLQSEPGRISGRLWVELAILGTGEQGRVKVLAGGAGAVSATGGALVRHQAESRNQSGTEHTVRTTTWRDGTIDRLDRVLIHGQPRMESGARTTTTEGWLQRASRVRIDPKFWRKVGCLPAPDGTGKELRRQLLDALPHLQTREAPGWRGRGDYVRGSTMTNLEFDTTLALCRAALHGADAELLHGAWRSARHLVDVDADPRSGLPSRHGSDHRSAGVEAGHVWLEGVRLVALRCADDDLLERYRIAVRALAQRVRGGEVPGDAYRDRLRDELWPLWELERALCFEALPPVRAAADIAASRVLARFQPELGVLRYGEGESRSGIYKERLWLSCGLALPALRLYLQRTGDRRAERAIAAIERRAQRLLAQGRPGIPTSCRVAADGREFGVVRARGAAEAVLMLDGLPRPVQRKMLRRGGIRSALEKLVPADSEDLATRWTLLGRTDLIWR